MYQKSNFKRNKKKRKTSNTNITKKDKLIGILAITLVVIAAFLLYYFVFKGNIHKH
ncbi:hypothetical protein C8D94_101871 [Marinirhabdus gelatinilytica]|uniref:Uncharacterized protein n=1 Tax=Marinirhabdus gelatinilytica TaxID=1703343 RepID=A0A370QKX7_9FLAO|nr:hypothetical protein C8D94_101871 [Marinirhabdus gelatinilytica]